MKIKKDINLVFSFFINMLAFFLPNFKNLFNYYLFMLYFINRYNKQKMNKYINQFINQHKFFFIF